MKKTRERIKEAKNLTEYINGYKWMWNNSCDASPFGIERTTEKRMIKELKTLQQKVNE